MNDLVKKANNVLKKEEIVGLMKDDPIERNQALIDFINILKTESAPVSISLNGEWGSGKTVFVKQLELLLCALNNNLESDIDINKIIKEDEQVKSFDNLNMLPIYFNAWENDWCKNPLVSLIPEIVKQTDIKFKNKIDIDFFEAGRQIINFGLKFFTSNIEVPALNQCVEIKDYLEEFHTVDEFRKKIVEFINIINEKYKSTILLIVDEIDRCKPDYSLALIEQLKALFADNKIIILYSVNKKELAHVVDKFYGYKEDGELYLERIFDLEFSLPPYDCKKLDLYMNEKDDNHAVLERVKHSIKRFYDLTIRDYLHFLNDIKSIAFIEDKSFNHGSAFVAITHIVCPLLLAIKIKKPSLYEDIIHGDNIELLIKEFKMCGSIYDEFVKAISFEMQNHLTSKDNNSVNIEYILSIILRLTKSVFNDIYPIYRSIDTDLTNNKIDSATACICNAIYEVFERGLSKDIKSMLNF